MKTASPLLILGSLICGLLITATPAEASSAWRRSPQEQNPAATPRNADAYSLEDIMDSPKEYIEREVMFYARFATTANLFKQINTRFNADSHVNVAVWPDKTTLWTEDGRKNILPTLYIAKNEAAALAMLKQLEKYDLVAVTGQVRNVYAGYPWILITNIEKVENPSEQLGEQVIEHMQAGAESLGAGAGGAAARHFEQALEFGLPAEYRGSAYRQLAQAYLLENRLDRAQDCLRRSVGANSRDPRLHLALADVCLQMEEPEEALAHASVALNLSGKYPQAYGIRGESLSLMGEHAQAFGDLNTAAGTPGITPREKAVISLRRARIYARSDRPVDAARLYAAISEPGEELAADPDVHSEIGLFYEKLYFQSGDEQYLESAAAAFAEAADLSTLNPVFLYNRAETEFRQGDVEDALAVIEKINRIDPDYAPARLLLGRVYFRQGKLEEAEAIYQSVAPQLNGDSMALLALAEAYIDLGRHGDALVAVRSAREAQPWNHRLQALGGHIEAKANGLMQAATETHPLRPADAALEATATDAPDSDLVRLGMADSMIDIVAAYASLPVPAAPAETPSVTPVADGEGVRIPPVFTFAPDTSPVIIADVRVQNIPDRRRFVRNANLYRQRGGNSRRPAEIVERESIEPHNGASAAMVGPVGAAIPRAEVRLPSSSQGIGMSTDYIP